ncbi:methyltransferase domain-containing protein [Phragmitibacter flavus]|uniref:Methyltransferase domain-containing protein n=1 Tax=Phragmitibacter flavus TaxID=2576071 RepID=A0A5R8KAB4_9BACT|nr:methyltransferase domain-containing protein [Phragmitibacter flavus]TLD69260.1 methyltransferase domain-containing protein [Phragmitibacter flavus]
MTSPLQSIKKLLPSSLRDQYRFSYYNAINLVRWELKNLCGLHKYPKNSDNMLFVHLGCGSLELPGFINVDLRAHPHVHHRANVDRLPFLKDGSIDLIYVSHCLEHISHRKIEKTLSEWRRVLKVGGILRIAVPDFDAVLSAYAKSQNDIKCIQGVLMGGQDYAQNFHYTTFNETFLKSMLENGGFEDVRRWNPSNVGLGKATDCSTAVLKVGETVIPVSLNLEAVKNGA